MFYWNKLGKIFDPSQITDKYWIKEYAQAPATLLFDDFVRVYFSCRSQRDSTGQSTSYSAFFDLDRKNITKIIRYAEEPILSLGEKGCFDEFGTYPVSVIREGNEIWGYYAGWTRCKSVPFNTAIGFAKSFDGGAYFDKQGNGPILSYSPTDPFIITGPKIRKFNNTYYLFYVCGEEWIETDYGPEMVIKIKFATSADGVNWIRDGQNIIQTKLKPAESQASPDVFYKNGKYHMFFCHWSPNDFRKTKSRRIGYASSTDLLTWERNDEKVGISPSDDGFDNEMQAYPHVFEVDNKIYMLYLGNGVGKYGIGIAQLEGNLE